ncbi:MAG: class II aldolase/adducin family protein, partial [Erysipelotrichaceae bacterium]|nr:class II aldolase/adducin family protein [Erysipelotrichaceae bacterium]
MYEKEKESILRACMRMKEYQLISLTGGNISLKIDQNTYIVTPSGMLYEDMDISDMCVIDHEGKLIEGKRKPSSDWSALIYIYDHMPEVRATIHTHQPYATAIGLVNESLPACMVTLIDANHARIHVAPWT